MATSIGAVTRSAPGGERLRAIHPLTEEDGSCLLVYDLERTRVLAVPTDLRPVAATELRSGPFGEKLGGWLRREGVLTREPAPSWAEGAAPRLPPLSDVSLDMSGACNMACTYCFENDIHSRGAPMSEDTALAALDFAFAASAGSPAVALHFGSGEPLLRFDLLRIVVADAVRRAVASGQRLTFELTTNATLVRPEVAVFLRDHPFSVRVSCDGPGPVHDRNRPLRSGRPSYRAVEGGLRLLLDHLPERVTVNSVISGGTRVREVWRWAEQMRLRHLHVIKVGVPPESDLALREQELREFGADLEAVCEDMRSDLEAERVPIDYQPITKIVRRLMIPRPITRFCGVAGSYLGVSTGGEVYPCFRHLGLAEYRLGDVRNGVSDDRRRRFMGGEAADVDTRPICRHCWARYLCGGGCYADSTVYAPDKFIPQVVHCPFWRTEVEVALRFYHSLLRTDPTYCLRLLGDDPDQVLQALGEGETGDVPDVRFLQSRNCS